VQYTPEDFLTHKDRVRELALNNALALSGRSMAETHVLVDMRLPTHSQIGTIETSFDRGTVVEQLDRITQQPEVMGGKACIRGMRVTAGTVVSQIGAGHSFEDVLADYPYLEREDIMQALRYATWRAKEREILIAGA
jgi:uncharacterized protein (DUF433 family)